MTLATGGALTGVPLVAVRRGHLIESLHSVAACAADAAGATRLALGDVDTPVFLRSAAKPFIAAAVVRSGAADAYGFDDRELALMSASHNGEPEHVRTALSMLEKAGIGVDALRCGAHAPSYEPAAAALAASGHSPTALHNNCSGKHAGILAMAKHLGAPLEGYLDAAHPAERAILDMCERLVGEPLPPERLAVDGCGIPVFATSLRRAARAFARFATLDGVDEADRAALTRVRAAMTAQPWYVGGTERFDTALIGGSGGAIVCKAGAEGVHASALLALGAGLVLKVVDGSRRAAPPAAVALLDRLGALVPDQRAALQTFASVPVRNVAGRIVGTIASQGESEMGFQG